MHSLKENNYSEQDNCFEKQINSSNSLLTNEDTEPKPQDYALSLESNFELAKKLIQNIKKVIIGKDSEIKLAIAALLADGHILIEDIPGVGKTTLAKALAKSIQGSFHRIQFTPDLLPSDITGSSVYEQQNSKFIFKPGPLFANIVLVDEINRATSRTQSSLLECMSEAQISVDGVTYPLEKPFFVMATENPLEHEGTYPLLISQLDRFAIKIHLGYPEADEEKKILRDQKIEHPINELKPVLNIKQIRKIQELVKQIKVDEDLDNYIVDLIKATRNHPEVRLGASPRGSLQLFRLAQAQALLCNRDYVIPDDIKFMVLPVLGHRLILPEGLHSPYRKEDHIKAIIKNILQQVPVPM